MKFRKKPVAIEAVQYTGMNDEEIFAFMGIANDTGKAIPSNSIVIVTLEGAMSASRGDWIIKGVKGEYYPCKPDIFALTYEPVAA